jgi:hypothetical protein
MLQDLVSWSPYTAQLIGLQIPYSLMQQHSSSKRTHIPRWTWLLIAALLGGGLGIGAHFSQDQESPLSNIQIEEVRTTDPSLAQPGNQAEAKSTLP